MQAEVVQLALDLLVREPDIDGFFGALSKTMVEESESYTCAVWLIDEDLQRCNLWMAYVKDRLLMPRPGEGVCGADEAEGPFPCASVADHLFAHTQGWTETVEYAPDDPRLPEQLREFSRRNGVTGTIVTPLLLGTRTLGWMSVCSLQTPGDAEEADSRWWRVVLIEAIAHQAALALHQNRLIDLHRSEERR